MASSLATLFQNVTPVTYEFLVREYGFFLQFETEGHFVAKSPYCQIIMEFEKDHFGCWFERLDRKVYPHHAIDVVVLAICMGYQPKEDVHFPNDADRLIGEIQLNRQLLIEFCSDFLRGDFGKWTQVIDCLMKRGQTQEAEFTRLRQENERDIERGLAQSAWSKKDYIAVVKHYGNIRSFLSPSELKKLEYASKKLGLES